MTGVKVSVVSVPLDGLIVATPLDVSTLTLLVIETSLGVKTSPEKVETPDDLLRFKAVPLGLMSTTNVAFAGDNPTKPNIDAAEIPIIAKMLRKEDMAHTPVR